MITTEEIATRVYAMLQASEVKNFISGVIDYERNDYTKEDVIIVPHTIDGEASVRYGQINVNIHVPDKVIAKGKGQAVYRTHFKSKKDIGVTINILFLYFSVLNFLNGRGVINVPLALPTSSSPT